MPIDFAQILKMRQAAQKQQGLPVSTTDPGGAPVQGIDPNAGMQGAAQRKLQEQQAPMPEASPMGTAPQDQMGQPPMDAEGVPTDDSDIEAMNQSATEQMGPQPSISQDAINTMIKYGILFGMLGGPAGGAPTNAGG